MTVSFSMLNKIFSKLFNNNKYVHSDIYILQSYIHLFFIVFISKLMNNFRITYEYFCKITLFSISERN